jgi:DNA-binding GntR family transcriptional regulator
MKRNIQKQIPKTSKVIKPLKRPEEITKIRKLLHSKPRDLLFFDLATQTGLKLQDLLHLKVGDLAGLKIGDRIPTPSAFPKSQTDHRINELVYKTFQAYCKETGAAKKEYLFKSKKTNQPLTWSSASHLVRSWYRLADLKGLKGARSLRKTWEVHFRKGKYLNIDKGYNKGANDALKPANPPTFAESVYLELLESIVSGRIQPGQRLVAQKIAQQVKVSYMPVREALAKLEAAGFIYSKRKNGFIVHELSQDNLREVIKIRLLLEPVAARRAAEIRSDGSVAQLEKFIYRYLRAIEENDASRAFKYGKAFHHTIYREANMPILYKIIDNLWDKLSPYYHMEMRERGGYDFEWFEMENKLHQGMLNGIKKKDPDMVEKYLKADLNATMDFVIGLFYKSRISHARDASNK